MWLELSRHQRTRPNTSSTREGNKERMVPIGGMALIALETWIGVRGQIGANGDVEALFVTFEVDACLRAVFSV